MKIKDIINSKKISFSFEIFPPKKGMELTGAKAIIKELATQSPSFISVTYGSTGDNSENTIEMAKEVQINNNVTALAHLTCVTAEKQQISEVLNTLRRYGIENILALRGDIPEGEEFPRVNSYKYASDLIKEIKKMGGFCIGGACYPEGHPESKSIEHDIENIKIKVDSGCDFLTTQMFFDNNILYNYMYKLLKNGINVPIIAGIMPITNVKQCARICGINGTALPQNFRAIVSKFADDPASLKQAGIAYATAQIIDLIANGFKNIHLYTMNKPDVAIKIKENISCLLM